MENPIIISNLNDFIFCPVSIYFHNLDFGTDKMSSQTVSQINGSYVHEKVDNGEYSSKKSILQGTNIYCEKYNLIGKIDQFDIENAILIERKKRVVEIYDGYIFQLYAQFFALTEMDFIIKKIKIYSYDDNKNYNIDLPYNNLNLLNQFEKLIMDIQNFKMEKFVPQNIKKCEKCIYEPCCSFSLL